MRGKNWDIFCRVIDNFGDIGFCWRLARQLAAEHGLQVRLWVDDLASFKHLCPAIEPRCARQTLQHVEIWRWDAPWQNPAGDIPDLAGDVVIEAFGCELPGEYLASMAARQVKPVWLNLEYLSAENWIGNCHKGASPHPRLPLTKHFFFPGFTPEGGGLLRESGLIRQRIAWQQDPDEAWRHLGLPPAEAEETSISLFCYDNSGLPALLEAWIHGTQAVRCLIPESAILAQVARCLRSDRLHAGEVLRRGDLTVHALPFLSQDDYDRLLWSCDLNFVRGEDSFVRAQWAARPFVWQIYPQDDAAHHAKLAAFLDLYCHGLPQPAAAACRVFWQTWNQLGNPDSGQAWPQYWQQRALLSAHAASWSARLEEASDLASQLVNFSGSLL